MQTDGTAQTESIWAHGLLLKYNGLKSLVQDSCLVVLKLPRRSVEPIRTALCLLFAPSPVPNEDGITRCLVDNLMAHAWEPTFNDPDALVWDSISPFCTMGFLHASRNFDISQSQLNDVGGDQNTNINIINNCFVEGLQFTSWRHWVQHSSLCATLLAAQHGPMFPLPLPPIFTYQPGSSKGQHGQSTSSDRPCNCGRPSPPPTPSFPRPPRPIRPSNSALDDPLVNHYLTCVVSIQYLLADKEATANLIYVTVQTNATVHEAVRLLAAVHQDKRRHGQSHSLETPARDSSCIYGKLSVDLLYKKQARYTQNDAMAALLVVSSVLFDGGTGDWKAWLRVTFDYLDRTFEEHGGAKKALKILAHDDNFIFVVKNAFWFDVIASATQQQKPHYYDEIDRIFHPHLAPLSPLLSMEDSIGCHNDIFWALNQTSAFSSMVNPFLGPSRDVDYTMEVLNSHAQAHHHPEPATSREGWSNRQYTSHMLCMATIVWLRSLMSGAHSVLLIEHTVQRFLQSLRNVPKHPRVERHIVRSSVFSIFICGLFVRQREDRSVLQDHLRKQSADSIGNCTAIVNLLRSIWRDHDTVTENGKWLAPVTWRAPLKKSRLLLV